MQPPNARGRHGLEGRYVGPTPGPSAGRYRSPCIAHYLQYCTGHALEGTVPTEHLAVQGRLNRANS